MFAFYLNYFFHFAAFAVLMPHLPIFFKARGFSISQVGMLLSAFGLAGVFGPILISPLADRSHRYRLIMLLSISGSVLFFFPLEFTNRLLVSLPFITLLGIAFKTIYPMADTLTLQSLEDPTRDYGRVRMLGSLGFVTSAFIVQFSRVIRTDSSSSILITYTVVAVFCFAVTFLLPRDSKHDKTQRRQSEINKLGLSFWFAMTIFFLGNLGMTAHHSFFSIYVQEVLGLKQVSGLWAIAAVSELPFIFFAGYFIHRLNVHRMLYMTMSAIIIRLGLYALLPTLGAVILAQLLHGICFGMFHTAAIEYLKRNVDAGQRGMAMAIYFAVFMGLTVIVGSFVGGFVVEVYGFRTLYLTYTTPTAVALILTIVRRRHFARSA